MNVEDSLGGKIDQTLSCFNYMDKYEHALYLFIACFSYMNPLNVCVLISFLLRDLLRGFLTAVSIGGGGPLPMAIPALQDCSVVLVNTAACGVCCHRRGETAEIGNSLSRVYLSILSVLKRTFSSTCWLPLSQFKDWQLLSVWQ